MVLNDHRPATLSPPTASSVDAVGRSPGAHERQTPRPDTFPMRLWITAGASFFAYIAFCALFRPRVRARSRAAAIAGSAAGFALCAAADGWPIATVQLDWILPPLVLLIAYRVSGLLFVAPMPRIEAILAGIDDDLGIDRMVSAMPIWTAELLETAYLAVSPLIAVSLLLHR